VVLAIIGREIGGLQEPGPIAGPLENLEQEKIRTGEKGIQVQSLFEMESRAALLRALLVVLPQ
jgi:hypothetical protein